MASLSSFRGNTDSGVSHSIEFYQNLKDRLKDKTVKIFKLIRKKRKLAFNPKFKQGRWNEKEHKEFIRGLFKIGKNNWKKVAFMIIYFNNFS